MADSGITQVGKYHIMQLIGEGAMGVVYRAVDPVLNRTVAIKVMNDALAREEELRARFLREAQAAGSLQHPNVITIFDFGEMEGHLYIAMEFVEGDDLEHVLHSREPLPLQLKLDIVTDVLSGLSYAHKRGIVHRDIKPANIRLTEERRAKIMDFGIAHLASSSATRTGLIVGTPDYMAPEQVTGGRITAATDLFSVGTVLYEILSGARPFQSPTVHGVLYKVVSEEPPPLQSLVPGLPQELYTVVQRALAKQPDARFASALEMLGALSTVRSALNSQTARQSARSLHAGLSSVSDRPQASAAIPASDSLPPTRITGGGRSRNLAIGVAAAALVVAGAGWALLASGGRGVDEDAAGAGGGAVPSATQQAAAPAPNVDSPAARVASAAGAQEERPAAAAPAPNTPAPRTAAAPTTGSATPQRLAYGANPPTPRGAAAPAGTTGATVAAPTVSAPPQTSTAQANDSARPRVVESAAAPPAAPVTSPPPASTVAAASIVPAPDPKMEIASVVAAYARAIESRDTTQLRRAYAGITAAQQRGFDSFFQSVRSLRAGFAVTALEMSGATADARLEGAYEYVTKAGRSERQPVTFRAAFRRDSSGSWTLTSVR